MRGSGGRSMPPVGSRDKAPGRDLGATPPEAEGFFCMSSQKTAFWSMKIRYLQVSSWRMAALCLTTTSRRSPLSTWCCVSVVAAHFRLF